MEAASLQEISSTLKKIAIDIDDSLDAQRCEKSSEAPKTTSDVSSILPSAKPKNDASVDSLRRDNLAKSVQWYSSDLINESISNACLSKLERILCSENMRTHTKYSRVHETQKFEKLLVDIKSEDYHTIEKCLHLIAENSYETVQLIWKLSKQYSQTNFKSCICGYCKIRKHVNIRDCSRYFWRHSIISDQLFKKIVLSDSDQASYDLLWNDLENELKQHNSKHIIGALNATLKAYFNRYVDLSTDIEEWLCDPKTKFKCSCQELHLQLLKPTDNHETDIDTFTTDYGETETSDTRKNRCISKSATRQLSFRRRDSKCRQIRSQSATNAKDQRQTVPKRSNSCETLSNPQCDTNVPINFDRKKATKIYNFNNIKGPISVGNRFVRLGNHDGSDTSNDTDDHMSYSSNMDLRKPLKSNDLKSTSKQGTVSANVSSCTSKASVSEQTATSALEVNTNGAESLRGREENHAFVTLQKSLSAEPFWETMVTTRNNKSMKIDGTLKHIADLTDKCDQGTADDVYKSQNSTTETQANLSLTMYDEDTGSSTVLLESDDSDPDTQSCQKVQWATPADDKNSDQNAVKPGNKHVKLNNGPASKQNIGNAGKNKRKSKLNGSTDDNNIDKNYNKSKPKAEHSNPTAKNSTKEKNDTTGEKQLEHDTRTDKNKGGKYKCNQRSRESDQTGDNFIDHNTDKTDEKNSQQKTSTEIRMNGKSERVITSILLPYDDSCVEERTDMTKSIYSDHKVRKDKSIDGKNTNGKYKYNQESNDGDQTGDNFLGQIPSNPTAKNSTKEKNDTTGEKQLERDTRTDKNKGGKYKCNQRSRESDQTGDNFIDHNTDKTDETNIQLKTCTEKSMNATSDRTMALILHSHGDSCVEERADMTKSIHSDHKERKDKSMSRNFQGEHSFRPVELTSTDKIRNRECDSSANDNNIDTINDLIEQNRNDLKANTSADKKCESSFKGKQNAKHSNPLDTNSSNKRVDTTGEKKHENKASTEKNMDGKCEGTLRSRDGSLAGVNFIDQNADVTGGTNSEQKTSTEISMNATSERTMPSILLSHGDSCVEERTDMTKSIHSDHKETKDKSIAENSKGEHSSRLGELTSTDKIRNRECNSSTNDNNTDTNTDLIEHKQNDPKDNTSADKKCESTIKSKQNAKHTNPLDTNRSKERVDTTGEKQLEHIASADKNTDGKKDKCNQRSSDGSQTGDNCIDQNADKIDETKNVQKTSTEKSMNVKSESVLATILLPYEDGVATKRTDMTKSKQNDHKARKDKSVAVNSKSKQGLKPGDLTSTDMIRNTECNSSTDDNNIDTTADLTEQKQTYLKASTSADKKCESTFKNKQKAKHSNPLDTNSSKGRVDTTGEKQLEHKSSTDKTTDGKCKGNQRSSDGDQTGDTFIHQNADKTDEMNFQQKTSTESSMDGKSASVLASILLPYEDGFAEKRTDMIKSKQNDHKAGKDEIMVGSSKSQQGLKPKELSSTDKIRNKDCNSSTDDNTDTIIISHIEQKQTDLKANTSTYKKGESTYKIKQKAKHNKQTDTNSRRERVDTTGAKQLEHKASNDKKTDEKCEENQRARHGDHMSDIFTEQTAHKTDEKNSQHDTSKDKKDRKSKKTLGSYWDFPFSDSHVEKGRYMAKSKHSNYKARRANIKKKQK